MSADAWLNVIIAAIGATGAVLGATLAAWLGIRYGRQTREEELYRDVGRLEGRGEGRVVQMPAGGMEGSGNLMLMLGQLMADVKNIQHDVIEIKNTQAIDRAAAKGEHDELRRVLQGQIDELKRAVVTIQTSMRGVTAYFRQMRREKK